MPRIEESKVEDIDTRRSADLLIDSESLSDNRSCLVMEGTRYGY